VKKIIIFFFVLAVTAFGQNKMAQLTWGVSIGRWVSNHQMVCRGPNLSKWTDRDGVYLGGTLLATTVPQLTFAFSNLNQKKDRHFGKSLYVMSLVVALARGGLTDAMIWMPQSRSGVMSENSGWYFASTILAAASPTAATFYWQPRSNREILLATGAGALLGSVAWDVIFCSLRYRDSWSDIPNWFGGIPIENSRLFAAARIAAGCGMLALSEILGSPDKKNSKQKWFVFLLTDKKISISVIVNF